MAQPAARLQVGAEHIAAEARELEAGEGEGAWNELTAANPQLTAAQHKAERTLPVVVLSPHR